MTDFPDVVAAAFVPFSDRLRRVYERMDAAYRQAADYYGFHCAGCEDNCCLTRFHHHTLSEYFYFSEGFGKLSSATRQDIRQKAEDGCRKSSETIRQMCPSNDGGLCLLYEYRPMICRLHGIPTMFRRPDGQVIRSPGCDVFSEIAGEKPDFGFDRTPFYTDMAMLEKELREKTGCFDKVKMTVSQMLVRFS